LCLICKLDELCENITQTKKIGWKTPHEIWFGNKFNLSRLRTFGCQAYINIPDEIRKGKFGDTAKEGILMGYRLGIPNWRILTGNSRVEYSHDVTFDEACFPGISPSDSVYDDFQEIFPIDVTVDDVIVNDNSTPVISDCEPAVSSPLPSSIPTPMISSPIPSPSSSPLSPSHPLPSPSSDSLPTSLIPKPKPGWKYVPADRPAPKNINSNPNDPSNILTTKQRAHLVNQELTTEPWFVAYFNNSLCYSSIAEANTVPKTYNAALKSPQSADWLEAI
jgi:hypothetical protein